MGEPGGNTSGSNEPSTSTASAGAAASSGIEDIDMSDPAIAGMTADELKKFIDTGRTGRRNAVPDVSQSDVSEASASGVADALGAMSVKDEPGPSSASKGS